MKNKFLYLLLGLGILIFSSSNCKKNDKQNNTGLGLLLLLSQKPNTSSFLLEIPSGLAK